MAALSNEILHDFSPLMRVYNDGRVERLMGEEFLPPSVDSDTGVESKDVELEPKQHLLARLYLPKNASPDHKLPVLVYFHGEAFLVQSAFSPIYQTHLNSLVAEANVIAISVNYRLAPEYPLPIAYEDSWLALKWLASHSKGAGTEVWLNDYANFDRVYLGGDSAGGNIAHNLAMRASSENLDGVNINGIFLNCPYFWGSKPIGDEDPNGDERAFLNRIWHVAHPTTSGVDDPLLNPAMDPNISSLGCQKVLVYVGGKDVIKYRGWYYKEILSNSGWVGDVEVLEVPGEEHVFNLFSPTSDNAVSMVRKLASFLNRDKATPCVS